jgi:hypothetical protein
MRKILLFTRYNDGHTVGWCYLLLKCMTIIVIFNERKSIEYELFNIQNSFFFNMKLIIS